MSGSEQPRQKIISVFPVDEIWAGRKLVSNNKLRDVGVEDLADLLRSGSSPRFVIGDVGKPFEWIPKSESYNFWKTEAKIHLAEPASEIPLEDFPDNYFYFASEWKSFEGETLILLSKMH